MIVTVRAIQIAALLVLLSLIPAAFAVGLIAGLSSTLLLAVTGTMCHLFNVNKLTTK